MTKEKNRIMRENIRLLRRALESQRPEHISEEEWQSHFDTVREELSRLEEEQKARVHRANTENRKRFKEI